METQKRCLRNAARMARGPGGGMSVWRRVCDWVIEDRGIIDITQYPYTTLSLFVSMDGIDLRHVLAFGLTVWWSGFSHLDRVVV